MKILDIERKGIEFDPEIEVSDGLYLVAIGHIEGEHGFDVAFRFTNILGEEERRLYGLPSLYDGGVAESLLWEGYVLPPDKHSGDHKYRLQLALCKAMSEARRRVFDDKTKGAGDTP